MSKKTIHIDRPDDVIPGLLEINELLVETCGVVLCVVVDNDDKERLRWAGVQLAPARIENDEIIITGDPLVINPKREVRTPFHGKPNEPITFTPQDSPKV